MLKHTHAALIHAWADGAEIECYEFCMNKWYDVCIPSWNPNAVYRIKQSKPKTFTLNGEEFPLPDGIPKIAETYLDVRSAGICRRYMWASPGDAIKVVDALIDLLSGNAK